MLKIMIGGTAIAVILTGSALAEDTQAEKQMAAAFTCSKLAYLAGKPDEQTRLLNIGIETGKRVIAAEVKLGKWPPLFKDASVDFLVGMTYSDFVKRADDSIRKADLNGAPLKRADWITDPNLVQRRAAIRYDKHDCASIGVTQLAQ